MAYLSEPNRKRAPGGGRKATLPPGARQTTIRLTPEERSWLLAGLGEYRAGRTIAVHVGSPEERDLLLARLAEYRTSREPQSP